MKRSRWVHVFVFQGGPIFYHGIIRLERAFLSRLGLITGIVFLFFEFLGLWFRVWFSRFHWQNICHRKGVQTTAFGTSFEGQSFPTMRFGKETSGKPFGSAFSQRDSWSRMDSRNGTEIREMRDFSLLRIGNEWISVLKWYESCISMWTVENDVTPSEPSLYTYLCHLE